MATRYGMTRYGMLAVSAAVAMAAGTARGIERSAAEAAAPAVVDVKLADGAQGGAGGFSGVEYAKSDRFGRAWVVLHYASRGPCPDADGECDLDDPVPVSVPGLTWDAAAGQVVYQRAGAAPVVCASASTVGLFGLGASLAETGACTARVVHVDGLVDDGFDGRRDRRDEIHLAVGGR